MANCKSNSGGSKDRPISSDPVSEATFRPVHMGSMMLTNQEAHTGWTTLVKEWSTCHLCPLGQTATNHVLGRGQLPCDLLFIGEAPGTVEDSCGDPFMGPSGRVLEAVIADTLLVRAQPVSYAIINVLACAPWEDDHKMRTPTPEEAAACRPRVTQTIQVAQPKGLVLLGRSAEKFVQQTDYSGIPVRQVYHPAYILRNGGVSTKNTTYNDCVASIRQFASQVLGSRSPR